MESVLFSAGSTGSSNMSYPTGTSLVFSPLVTALYISIYLPLWLSIIFVNLLVIFAFVYHKELRKVQYYLLVSLAVTDLLTGVFALPPLVFARLVVSPPVCFASTRFYFFLPSLALCGSSVYHLLFIAIDRCLSLKFPLRYPRLVTSRRVIILIVIIWLYNLSIPSMPLYFPEPEADKWVCVSVDLYENVVDTVFLAIACFIPFYFVSMMLLYMVMLRVSFNQIRKRRGLTSQGNALKDARARMRGIVTMAMVVGAFGICWIPTSVKFFYETFAATTHNKLIAMQTFAEYLSFVNSMVNPLIYSYFNQQFKIGFKVVLTKWGCLRKNETAKNQSMWGANLALNVSSETQIN